MTPQGSCFHCGEPLPPGSVRTVRIDDEDQPVCCPGCAAVATLIAESGLSGFYRYRSGPAPTPTGDAPDEWSAYDRDAVQSAFVQDADNGQREAVLLIEGLYCAACAWLIEHILTPIDGVQSVEVNPATGRALLRWDPERVALSTLFRRMSEIGYRPHPVDEEGAEPLAIRERRAALRRLGVAGLGTVGAGTLQLLQTHYEMVAQRGGRPVLVTAVAARDRRKDRGVDLSGVRWFEDPVALARDPEIDVLIELIGGAEGPAGVMQGPFVIHRGGCVSV